MADEQPPEAGRRRTRGPEATARSGALERLKALRSGGRRSDAGGFQIKMENPIYDVVEEDEYETLVAKRREEARGFIIDDDGLGYGDEGEEEDWSRGGAESSDEEESNGGGKPKRKKAEGAAPRQRRPPSAASASLSAAAAMMGKQRLSSMFTSSVFKTSRGEKGKGLSYSSVVDDVIAEFAPDEADRESRRRVPSSKSFPQIAKPSNSVASDHRPVSVVEPSIDSDAFDSEMSEVVDGNGGLDDELGQAPLDLVPEGLKQREAVEVKSEPTAWKKEEFFTLNAKITKEEKDPAFSATAQWKALRSEGSNAAGINGGCSNSEELKDFSLDSDGSLPFYILDAYEEFYGANMGNLYLFGKVKAGNAYQSCCVVVKNTQRCVYAIPNRSTFDTDEIMRLEKDAEESRISSAEFHRKLQDVASGLKSDVSKRLLDLNASSFTMKPVKRKYAFERSDIPTGENYVLKINYPFKDPPLPTDLKGEAFSALLGTHNSALELFLVKRKIKGPSWLSIAKFIVCPASPRVSWCKFEVVVDTPKDIRVSTSSKMCIEIPPVTVAAINLKTIVNEKQNVHEIIAASIVSCHKAKIDTPMLASEWNKPGMLSHFTVVRKLDGRFFPTRCNDEASERNLKARSNVISFESSERALLSRLMAELHKLDSDVLVGHNISGFDLDVLLHRAQACKVPSNVWSKIGRLRRSVMPKLSKGNTLYGSGASLGIMSCISGRLLCDTYLCSRDLLREVSYSLTQLAKTQLNKDRKELTAQEIPLMFEKFESLQELIDCGETDALLSMELMFHLSVLPLTRQLTNISGNLWGKTLQGARAQRVEYLLLHAFHAKKYIVPDKISSYEKEANLTKKRLSSVNEENGDDLEGDEANLESDAAQKNHGKRKKGPSYAGGLVLEPKRGLYDKYILLLDFNSLYPSIIQEYNICFTTVERSSEGSNSRLPSSNIAGVLPELLKNLVERRKMVKSWMKKSSGIKLQQLDVQQQALKLTANSMYGCLGFSNSRFYAKPLAELITLQGREILQSTVDLVRNNLNLEVIYGDTDSIMIYSGLDDIAKANEIAGKVKEEVNKKYRCLEIDLDGLYKRMLLLKKKKYAAVKVMFRNGEPYEVIERKGLDMVRRDWSLLAKECGDFCLGQILSGGSCEDVVEAIHNSLMEVQEKMRKGEVELEKYVITKTLTKPPEAYSDAKNQPHVQVAKRLKDSGYSTGWHVGDTIPYVICCDQGNDSGGSTGIAQRARHSDELKEGKWMIDIEYYLSQQIHPVVSRLCASIQGTSPERLADCLGLDSSKFKSSSADAARSDPSSSLGFSIDDEERYRGCESLMMTCPSCSESFDCPVIFSSVCKSVKERLKQPQGEESVSNFWHRLKCPKCPEEGDVGKLSPAMIANQVKMQADGFVSMYYKGVMTCDDETCKYTTRCLNLRVLGDSERGTVCPNYPACNGNLTRKYTEAGLYKQLSFFCHVLDTVTSIEKMDSATRLPVEKELIRIRASVNSASSIVQKIRDRCAYGWVNLQDLSVTV